MDIELRKARRNSLFQELKPVCVTLSQFALRDDGSTEHLKAIEDSTSHLLQILQQKCRSPDTNLDEKLADYVFFPLSHVLKRCQRVRGRLAELATQCLRVLLEQGWKRGIPIDLAHQLWLLLTVFAGGGPANVTVAEELRTEAYGALAALFQDLQNTPKGPSSLVEVSRIPALGHCLTVILEGVTDGSSAETQMEALAALGSLWSCVKDQQARADFLPGTVSALTKCLMPNTQTPRKWKVLAKALDVLKIVLILSLGDVHIISSAKNRAEAKDGSTLTDPWLKATGSQIKLALANVVKLKMHKREEVRRALMSLCLAILDECHTSLIEPAPLLVETSMSLSELQDPDQWPPRQTTLRDLVAIYPSVTELVKNITYNWSTSFPRIMQSNDESSKHTAMHQLLQAYRLLAGLNTRSETLNGAMLDALRDGVVGILELTGSVGIIQESPVGSAHDTSLMLAGQTASSIEFRPIIMLHESQVQSREQLESLIRGLGSSELQVQMATDMLARLEWASGTDLLSTFWLAFQLVKASQSSSKDLETFLSPVLTSRNQTERIIEELYAYSLSVLLEAEDDSVDWRLLAVGLEVIALSAQSSGESFRPDLVDVLYPIVQLLGSPNLQLRAHAVTSLNIISKSCGYNDTSTMILDNVDYLVNAISLKLDTFDISPRAPQVLIMMVKLSGPSLLPYLDDVVGSIFAALENFHGYPRLVETLFSVLIEIVHQGSRSDQLLPIAAPNTSHRKKAPQDISVDEIVNALKKKKIKSSTEAGLVQEDFPRRPWKSAKELLDQSETSEPPTEKSRVAETDQNAEVEKAPPTKTYAMLQSITRLGQHYLTSQSALLRRRLLDLISTACDALYVDEDEFLPLINDIWPVIIKRLYDKEPFVVVAASRVVAGICTYAGDFVSTRIKVEWPRLTKLFWQTKNKAETEMKGSHARGIYAHNWQVWEGFINLMISIVEHVRIDDDMFDEALSILSDTLARRDDVHRALSAFNADAVWLEEQRRSSTKRRATPLLTGYRYSDITNLSSTTSGIPDM
ncbi:MAG: hypothetical protein M1818_007143 [Claussenomyces sp. TS43310]|nr:MAG: hypothetical protein M1818_007143 [Claussenomyces sp. TS43310]